MLSPAPMLSSASGSAIPPNEPRLRDSATGSRRPANEMANPAKQESTCGFVAIFLLTATIRSLPLAPPAPPVSRMTITDMMLKTGIMGATAMLAISTSFCPCGCDPSA
ncbi:MAG: hypothetical protein BWX70_03085 [Verrucomicrobia bacterium ADurb.Bin070]|nr:MAG: hypothetical protein BWX70_03085 [Verrucomicrobia bacterium ADurb.Bin070]